MIAFQRLSVDFLKAIKYWSTYWDALFSVVAPVLGQALSSTKEVLVAVLSLLSSPLVLS